jgi:hypothetical protein
MDIFKKLSKQKKFILNILNNFKLHLRCNCFVYNKLKFCLFLVIFLVWCPGAHAGFGISPPYFENNQLVPGSHYEQDITLLRSSADEDMQAEIKINAPKIEKWLKVAQGNTFIIKKGLLQVPIKIIADVPKDAEIGNYKGYINIRVSPIDAVQKAGVSIALGARVEIDLTLTNVVFSNFIVHLVSVPDFELLGPPWNWPFISKLFNYLFYRVRIAMDIENTGNTKTAPTRVHVDVYDLTETKLLESSDDKSIDKIDSFKTKTVMADFPTKLPVGQYWGNIKIYKDSDIVNTYKIGFSVSPAGSLGNRAPDLGRWPWVILAGIGLALLGILALLIKIKIWKYIFRLIKLIIILIALPLRPLYKLLKKQMNKIKAYFWKWIRNKAKEYDDNDK